MEGFVLFGWQNGLYITWRITSDPALALRLCRDEGTGERRAIYGPLPYWLAEAGQNLLGETCCCSPFLSGPYWFYARIRLARFFNRFKVKKLPSVLFQEEKVLLPQDADLNQSVQFLQGRILLEQEAKDLLADLGENLLASSPDVVLETLIWQKRVQREAALFRDRAGRWHCRRCGSVAKADLGACSYCGRTDCAICTECASLGVARSCQAIVKSEQITKNSLLIGSVLKMPFVLSPPQQDASSALAESDEDALVWAACGAGKTEVVFSCMEKVLKTGGEVLFAIPRRDIVKELENRLKKAFPQVRVKALYGGVADRYQPGHITIATTHQVLRFYRKFSLVILDEVDAFPYKGNQMLHRAMERARLPGGRKIFLTATPTENLLQKAYTGQIKLVTIPARHHCHLLPVPELVEVRELVKVGESLNMGRKKVDLSQKVLDIILQLIRKKEPLLVFVPTVKLANPTAGLLDSIYRSGARPSADALPLAVGVHSREPRRDAFIKAFVKGEIPVLVATTVMERGITVPGVNVVVLWADSKYVFDSPTLIQMAGRAGRTKQKPCGEVYFIGSEISEAMKTSRRRIEELNRIALEKGYIHPSPQ
jgi:competence protein ComFA